MTNMELRTYQAAAVRAVVLHLEYSQGNPCVCIPTGGGKTVIAAQLAKDTVGAKDGRVLVLSHVKELVDQTARTLARFDHRLDVGIHSAGLGKRDQAQDVLVAGIQSVYDIAHSLGKFTRIVVDEAHRIPEHAESMYQRLLADLGGGIPLIGLTATPYRMTGGSICGEGKLFDKLVHETSVLELTERGLLAPLKYLGASDFHLDEIDNSSGLGDFLASVTSEIMRSTGELDCKRVLRECADRQRILIFCVDVAHAESTVKVFHSLGEERVDCVVSDTLLRDEIVKDFRVGKLRILVNVGVLTTGFDVPEIDAIVLMRPTLSKGLHYQMIGRGLRPSLLKSNCLVLDLVGNCVRHGLVGRSKKSDQRMTPASLCAGCKAIYPSSEKHCPTCGEVGGDPDDWFEVLGISYSIHSKEGKPDSLRVDYRTEVKDFSEWVCLGHKGYARTVAEQWWRERSSAPCPTKVPMAIGLIYQGAIRRTVRIQVQAEGMFDRVVSCEWESMPVGLEVDKSLEVDYFSTSFTEDDVPF